jgi:hypothetical protein
VFGGESRLEGLQNILHATDCRLSRGDAVRGTCSSATEIVGGSHGNGEADVMIMLVAFLSRVDMRFCSSRVCRYGLPMVRRRSPKD